MDCSTVPVCAMWGGCSSASSGALPDGSRALLAHVVCYRGLTVKQLRCAHADEHDCHSESTC
eukprot:8138508-Alexandrium_andersonii.AAC.1